MRRAGSCDRQARSEACSALECCAAGAAPCRTRRRRRRRPHTRAPQGWHPGSFKNTEKVWKKEQEAEAEKRKMEELQKQLEDERKANEYVEIAAAAGHKRCARVRLEYGSGVPRGGAVATSAGRRRRAPATMRLRPS